MAFYGTVQPHVQAATSNEAFGRVEEDHMSLLLVMTTITGHSNGQVDELGVELSIMQSSYRHEVMSSGRCIDRRPASEARCIRTLGQLGKPLPISVRLSSMVSNECRTRTKRGYI
jgi:hypothetical protein